MNKRGEGDRDGSDNKVVAGGTIVTVMTLDKVVTVRARTRTRTRTWRISRKKSRGIIKTRS